MKKSIKRVISVLLCAVMLLCPLTVGVSAKDNDENNYPFVFVHGMTGWGKDDGIYEEQPYWGQMQGDLMSVLEADGYECIVASVGPFSSAWDRACELYAQLVGTTVDYGAAHSKEHNHARFGRTYAEPLAPDWDENHPINLVGHSLGGVTSRLLVQLLCEGDPAEIACTAENDISPLFTGGLDGRVFSVTTLASGHNGVSYMTAADNFEYYLDSFFFMFSNIMGSTELNKYYDPQLEHFGLSTPPDMPLETKIDLIKSNALAHQEDSAMYDCTIQGAMKLNEKIDIQPDVYYYSYAGCKTFKNPIDGHHLPSPIMNPVFLAPSYIMGKWTGYASNGFYVDESWYPNDGLVNVVSAKAPFDEPSKEYNRNVPAEPGVWHVMPVVRFEHMQFVGFTLYNEKLPIEPFYKNMMKMVVNSGK